MDVQLEYRRYVLTHRDCIDGSAAQYAAWKKFGESATYISVQYDEPLPRLEDGSEVYVVDFSYSRKVLIALEKRMRKLVVLDHHKTAAAELEGLSFAKFDMNKSGAVMAWEYFHPELTLPEVFKHVQDRDLWKFKIPGTREVTAGLLPMYKKMKTWDTLTTEGDVGEYFINKVRNNGAVILDYQEHLIKEISGGAKTITLWGVPVVIVNSIAMMRSELGQYLLDMYPSAKVAIVAILEGDSMKLSFRSKGEDISWMAENLGGGGHGSACSAYVDFDLYQDILSNQFAQPYSDPWWVRLVLKIKNRLLRWTKST